MDFAKRRTQLQTALELNAIMAGELSNEARNLQHELRQLEIKERIARDIIRANPPTGIGK